MSKYEELDWYETPLWYDLVFDEDTETECDFLEEAVRRFGRTRKDGRRKSRVLEPACGSGRLLEEMARRGWSASGFDASAAMVDYSRRRLRRRRLLGRGRGEVRTARLEAFRYREKFELAHCLVSTFKYLLDERSARDHLHCVARALKVGGIYVLGFHLSDYDGLVGDRERWVGARAGVKVVCTIETGLPSITRRRELVRSRLVVTQRGRAPRRTETNWWFRTYDAAEVKRLLRSVPQLEHVATYDFHYDWSRPRALDDRQLDVVLVLRRR